MSGADFISASAKANQRAALLAALKLAPLSSMEARERLGIVHPAGRILELRRQGHDIATKRGKAIDAHGRQHACALYVLTHEGAEHV